MTENISPVKAVNLGAPAKGGTPQTSRKPSADTVRGEQRAKGGNVEAKAVHDREAVERIVEEMDRSLAAHRSDLSIAVDEDTGQTVVRIKDSSTGEVVKQFPAQEILETEVRVDNIIGLLIDDQA